MFKKTLSQFKNSLSFLIPNQLTNTFYHLPLAIFATLFYRYPAKNLIVIGVTGTDGKTTTANLIYEILKKAKRKVALISTVCAKIGKDNLSTGLHVTSPSPWKLQRLLRLITDKGTKFVVLESTSHGLDQHRLFGANFYMGVITNITWEHIDYHKTYNAYLSAKAKLIKKTKISVLNLEDKSFKKLNKRASGKIITYALKKADFTPRTFPFKTKLLGDFNKLNCLAAIAAARNLNISSKIIKKTVRNFSGVIGRMDEIKSNRDFRIFIDFAHTPNGLENALKTLKSLPCKKLIVVFGCAGLRDVGKRSKMGKVACLLADRVVLTAEDPRTEDLNKIISQIKSGCGYKHKVVKKPNRQEAINFAINKLAKKDDIVGIFGKGHEKSICYGAKETPWSEHKAVKKALKEGSNEKH